MFRTSVIRPVHDYAGDSLLHGLPPDAQQGGTRSHRRLGGRFLRGAAFHAPRQGSDMVGLVHALIQNLVRGGLVLIRPPARSQNRDHDLVLADVGGMVVEGGRRW